MKEVSAVTGLAVWMLQSAGGSFLGGFPFLIIMMVVLFAVMVIPGQRKQKQWAGQLAKMKTGDKVTTTGGLRGTVHAINDDVVVLRVRPDGVKVEVAKSAVAAITTDEVAKS